MKRLLTVAAHSIFGLAAFGLAATAQAELYSENWDDGAGATRWSDPIVDQENGADVGFDGLVDYAYDYSTAGILASPSSGGTTIGARFAVNVTDDIPGDEGSAVGIIANDAVIPAGPFKLDVEVYYFVDPAFSATATEYITVGAFASGPNAPGDPAVQDDVPFRFGLSNGDGLAWQVTGDGGSATDIYRYEDAGNADTGSQTGLGSLDDIPFGTIPGVTTGGGNPNDPFEPFGLQNRWTTITIEQGINDQIRYQLNGATINSIDNSGGTFSGGSIMTGLTDAFNSATPADGVFLVVDNVTLSIPEPTSLMLLVLGAIGLAARRR